MTDLANRATDTIAKPESQAHAIWVQFRNHKGALVGLTVLAILVVAVVLSVGFCWYAWRLRRHYSDQLARATFRFSLIHLSALFAALLLDHYLL